MSGPPRYESSIYTRRPSPGVAPLVDGRERLERPELRSVERAVAIVPRIRGFQLCAVNTGLPGSSIGRGSTGGAIASLSELRQVPGEVLKRCLGLGLLLAGEVDAAAGRERACLGSNLEGLGWIALGGELQDPGVVWVHPHLGDQPAGVARSV